MELVAENEGWRVHFRDAVVDTIQIDRRVSMKFMEESQLMQVVIETTGNLHGPDVDAEILPEEPTTLSSLLLLMNTRVEEVTVTKRGLLSIRFSGGRSLAVPPDEQYEAWQISAQNCFMIVCQPGGSVSLFTEQKRK